MSDEKMKLLADWMDFAKDVMPSDAAGYDWLRTLRERSEAALKQSPAADGWMPIETAPKSGLCWLNFGNAFTPWVSVAYRNPAGEWFCNGSPFGHGVTPTHWMRYFEPTPIQAPPKQHGEGG